MRLAVCSAVVGLAVASVAHAQPRVRLAPVATVPQAIFAASPPGDLDRLFVVQRTGGIRIVRLSDNTVLPDPFLTVLNVNPGGEQGMLGLAFHPRYDQHGWLYFYYTRTTAPATVIARCRVSQTNPNLADPATLQDVLVVPDPGGIHQAGWIGFGPDGLLYIPLGDNGLQANAQSSTTLRGKILRIDVDGPDDIPGNADDDGFLNDATKLYTIPATNPFLNDPMPDEVWAVGVRNPFRCSFDRLTGDFWVGDVGGGYREEVTRLTTASGGANLGWPCAEGNRVVNASCLAAMTSYVGPVFDYRTSGSTISWSGCYILGGYVYRGAAFPCLRGAYVFGDGCSGLASLRPLAPGQVQEFIVQSGDSLQSLAEDARGELYTFRLATGAIRRIEADGFWPGTPDCDANGLSDACELQQSITLDTTGNGIPDGCESLCTDIDFNNNGIYPEDQDLIDYLRELGGAGDCPFPACDTVDFNRDQVFPDDQDVIDFFTVLAGGSC